MMAAMQLVKGTVGAALIGGVDEANEMLVSVLDRLSALAHADGALGEAARPFDDRRNGLVIGEGAAMFVAGAGTRKPYGWLSGFGIARDTTASLSGWGTDAEAVVTAMKAAIDDAGLPLDAIDAIYASANALAPRRCAEQAALGSLFGASMPAVVATKGIFGEYAAGGALQLAAALIALEEQRAARVGRLRGRIAAVDARHARRRGAARAGQLALRRWRNRLRRAFPGGT